MPVLHMFNAVSEVSGFMFFEEGKKLVLKPQFSTTAIP